MSNDEQFNTTHWDADSVRRENDGMYRTANSYRRRRHSRWKSFFAWLIFVAVSSLILAGVGWLLANDLCAFNKEPLTATVEVTRNDDLNTISAKLKAAGLVEYRWFFKLFGKVCHAENKIGIGSYELSSDMDYKALIYGMRNRNATLNADTVRVSIPEGYSVRQIISLLADYGVSTEEALLDTVNNDSFDYGFLDPTRSGIAQLEGYLFPDTYDFFVGENPHHALCRLLDNFNARVDAELMVQVESSGYTLGQILTIASLIEKETDGSDHEKIASVIYNRLNNVGETYYKLQIDASLIYGLGYAKGEVFEGPLNVTHLETDTPYNLSIHEGLPPTAIGNPGLKSIKAALDPAQTSYYFYALGKDGKHHFFKTYAEHVNFVNSSQYGG